MAEGTGLVRYTVDGAVDTGWGDGGVLSVELPGRGTGAEGLSIADPMYYVGGTATVDGDARFAVARVHSSGLMIQRYGDDGLVVTEFSSPGGETAAVSVTDSAGALVVAGRVSVPENPSVAVAKYDRNGRPDESFGEDGIVLTDLAAGAGFAHDIAVDAGDRLVVGGVADTGGSHEFALLRYRPGGELDADFGAGGVVTESLRSSFEAVRSVLMTPDRLVVVAGTVSTPDGGGRFAVRRYDDAGRLDPEFGDCGTLTPSSLSSASPTHIAIDYRGRVLVAGTAEGDDPRAVVARYRSNGRPDESFAGDGRTTAGPTGGDRAVTAFAVDDCARPVVAEAPRTGGRGPIGVSLHRFNTDGSPDRTFGGDGSVATDVRGDDGRRTAVATDSRDRVVVAGTVRTASPER